MMVRTMGSATMPRAALLSKGNLGNKTFASGRSLLTSSLRRIGSTTPARRCAFPSGSRRGTALGLRVYSVAAPESPSAANVPTEAHNFELVRREFVKEYDSDVLVYKHKTTGAELMSLVNGDENKTFGVVFRTPVSDSTGVPHILEHSVLCGSRKYPVKEPFTELIKGSLNTFLNAMTYPDRTCYPVASCNLQDFYNLVDVYMDAVFFPNCVSNEKIFEQEGWHFELDNEKDPLTYKGVVFNEMKGVYSSADSMNYRVAMQKLFPNNNYQHDSGGDPEVIPSLSYEQFKEFHGAYYHPSNARFWFYGDDPVEERLRILDDFIGKFERKEVDSRVQKQPLLKEAINVEEKYAAGETENKAFFSINWLMAEEAFDTETELGMDFLNYLMLGTPASPLYKALMDSGLGETVIGGGLEDDLRQPFFGVGLKGIDPADTEKVEKCIMAELERLANEGFSSTAIEAAINTIEFSLRENNTGRFPRGLSLMLRAVSRWVYERDPLESLKWEEPLRQLKEKLASGEKVFEPLIKEYLLENPHKMTLKMLPDQSLAKQTEAKEKSKLEGIKSTMKNNEISATQENTAALKKRQETPDSPEALKCVPCLQLSDIKKEITTVPTVEDEEAGATFLTHDLFTNDVLYLEMLLELRTVPEDLLPLIPLFCQCLTQMGTEKESFVELTERIGRKTGGLSVYPYVSSKRGSSDPVAKIIIQGKAMKDKSEDMLALMHDVLLTARLDDKQRFKQMVLETKAGLESGIVTSGHAYVSRRLGAQRSSAAYVNELMGGLSYLEFIRQLVDRVDNDWDSVQKDLETIRSVLLNRRGAIVNMTADEGTLMQSRKHIVDFLNALPDEEKAAANWSGLLPRINEAITVPTQVNYVGKGFNMYEDAGYELSGSAMVVEKHIYAAYLWDHVRVIGGAYGAFFSLNTHSGMAAFGSYRDPNILSTLDSYDATSDFLKKLELDESGLTKAIIGTIGDIDAYQLPDAKGYNALIRRLLGVTDEERQIRRDQVLSTTVKDFQKFGDYVAAVKTDVSRVVAVTSQDTAEKINEEKPGFWEIKKVL